MNTGFGWDMGLVKHVAVALPLWAQGLGLDFPNEKHLLTCMTNLKPIILYTWLCIDAKEYISFNKI